MAWGGSLLALDDDHIGQCLGTTGIYDLAVSELLFRLIRPGDLVVEAPSYLATLAPVEVRAACVKRGWMALRKFPNPQTRIPNPCF